MTAERGESYRLKDKIRAGIFTVPAMTTDFAAFSA
jgi:hypothetical protein